MRNADSAERDRQEAEQINHGGNMTRKELEGLYYLRKEIERDEERIEELRAKAESCTQQLSDMPHGSGISDKTSEYVDKIIELQLKIFEKALDCIEQETRITDFLRTIDDPLIRLIIELRHVDFMKWRDIAQKIGGENTEDSVRMMHGRFLKKLEKS
jgi:hypothetical protein